MWTTATLSLSQRVWTTPSTGFAAQRPSSRVERDSYCASPVQARSGADTRVVVSVIRFLTAPARTVKETLYGRRLSSRNTNCAIYGSSERFSRDQRVPFAGGASNRMWVQCRLRPFKLGLSHPSIPAPETVREESNSMIFVLSIIPSALFTACYTYLFLYREATLSVKVTQTVLRFAASFICYVVIYPASMMALGAIYLTFDWSTGGETAFRIQFIGLTLFASLCSVFVATRRSACTGR